LIEIRKKEKLHKRNISGSELLAKTQYETALHLQNDMGKPFRIRTNLISRTSCKRCQGSRIQGK
jgi:hypothetical protein